MGQRGGNAALATRLLRAVDAGEASAALRDELAESVLADRRVRLALEVKSGGPHSWRRAIELAELLITEDAAISDIDAVTTSPTNA